MDIPTSWNLGLIFKTDEEIEKARSEAVRATEQFVEKWEKRNDYPEQPEILKEALDDYNNWMADYGTDDSEWYYYFLKLALDQDNPELKAKSNLVRDIAIKLHNQIQFFELRLAKIDISLQQKFLDDDNLSPYKHFLEKLFKQAKHILTEAEEKIMVLQSPTSYSNWVQMTEEFLSKEEREVLNEQEQIEMKSFSEITASMNNNNKKVRDKAAEAFNDIAKKYIDVAEHEINSVLSYKKMSDELRKYERPDQSRHLSDDVETEVVDTLVKTVSLHFEVAEKYYRLKAKLLGVEKLAYHERNIEYGKIDKKYNYDDAAAIIDRVFSKLDPELGEIYHQFLDQGRIDVFPKKGKQVGAFAINNLIINPTYLLLNFSGQLVDITTMAHELGHGINYELVRKAQNAINYGTTVATTEVASTFMEDFVLQELEKEADDELKLSLLMMKLNDDISTIFRQIAFYNFETDLHTTFRKKGYLAKDEIGRIFQKHTRTYMGEVVSQDPGSENWWIHISHFRMYFYVYSYASGLLISKSLQAKVKEDPTFINKIKEFLSAGLSESPKNIFAKLDIDITKQEFWEEGIKEIENTLIETEKLAKKLGKI